MLGGYGVLAYQLAGAAAGLLLVVGIGVIGIIWSRVVGRRRA